MNTPFSPDSSHIRAREDGLTGKIVYTPLPGYSEETVWSFKRSGPVTSSVPLSNRNSNLSWLKEDVIALRLGSEDGDSEVLVNCPELPLRGASVEEVGPHAVADTKFYRERVYSVPLQSYVYLSGGRWERILEALQKRTLYLAALRFWQFIGPFSSVEEQYRSEERPYMDLVGYPFVPTEVDCALKTSERYYTKHNVSIFEHLVNFEIEKRVRIVEETEEFVLICPYVSEYPYEMMLIPKASQSSFERMSPAERASCAHSLSTAFRSVKNALGDVECNILWYNAPYDGRRHLHFRWYIRIIPDVRMPGMRHGVQLVPYCPVAPEDAATRLRQ